MNIEHIPYISHIQYIEYITMPFICKKKYVVKSGSVLIHTELNYQNYSRSLVVHVEHAGHLYSMEARYLSTALR